MILYGEPNKEPLRVVEPKCEQVAQLQGGKYSEMTGRVYAPNGIAHTCRTCSGGNTEIKVAIFDEQNGTFVKDGLCNTLTTDGSSPKHNGRVVEFTEPAERFFAQAFETLRNNEVTDGDTIDAYNKKVNKDGVSPTVTTRPEGFKTAILPVQNYRIRKLTPRECFRLMGVKDADFDKIAQHQSNSKLYHLAGDSICVDVLMAIFGAML